MEPNPQMKMMLYVMPVMMTVLFLNFASGLNLYYAVQQHREHPAAVDARARAAEAHGPPDRRSEDGAAPVPRLQEAEGLAVNRA